MLIICSNTSVKLHLETEKVGLLFKVNDQNNRSQHKTELVTLHCKYASSKCALPGLFQINILRNPVNF